MRTRTWMLVCGGTALGCASSSDGPSLDRSGERLVDVRDRSGTIVSTRLRSDDRARVADLAVELEVAWARLPSILADLGLSIGTIDETSHRVSQSGERVSRIGGERMSSYVDCGRGVTAQPHADQYEVSLSYEVHLSPDGPDTSHAAMRVDASARPRDVRGNSVRCVSKGTLEELVFDSLRRPSAAVAPIAPRSWRSVGSVSRD